VLGLDIRLTGVLHSNPEAVVCVNERFHMSAQLGHSSLLGLRLQEWFNHVLPAGIRTPVFSVQGQVNGGYPRRLVEV
jgi:hypothetical protein